MSETDSSNSTYASLDLASTENRPLKTPIIGIGASAGGLSPLETLFEQIPADTGAAFVIIQHLSPDYQSHMPELLARRTSMRTVQMTAGVTPQPNTVYLMPPGKQVELVGEHLVLSSRGDDGTVSLPIDRFFGSLGKQSGRRIAAVILSGTGSDGSVGVQNVAQGGGLVLCQDEDSAQFNGMPLSAIRTEAVHVIAPIPEIAEAITSFTSGDSIDKVIAQSSPTIERSDLMPVYRLLSAESGIDFTQYKHGTFSRRLSRRMMLSGVDHLTDYVKFLDEDPTEICQLNDDLLIGVTRFFRDEDGFVRLRNRVVRPAIRSKKLGEEYRVWIAGCATGQEAYSIAMMIHEERRRADSDCTIKIFATDVHPDAIRFAQVGRYPRDAMLEIPSELRERYVVAKGNEFELTREIRDSIVFARHDLLHDAPFTNLDLISCRNLLIYLLDEAQRQVLVAFAHSLRTRGVLWLGPSETCGEVADQFSSLDKNWRLFQKERETRLPLDLKLRARPVSTARIALRPRSTQNVSPGLIRGYDEMLEMFAPPSILVDEDFQPVQFFGDVSPYAQTPKGRLSGSAEDFVAEPLRTPLAISLQRLRLNGGNEQSERCLLDGRSITLRIRALSHGGSSDPYYLILFEDSEEAGKRKPDKQHPNEPASETKDGNIHPSGSSAVGDDETEIALLQERLRLTTMELEFTRENLQATVEELETTNEELQSSNEELTSSNEELQSTNEELHSVNEELHSTNAESERRVQLLSETTADLESVLRENSVGLILLDRELNIRRITPSAAKCFRVATADVVGESVLRRLGQLGDLDLGELIEEVRGGGEAVEYETVGRDGDAVLLRVAPYQQQDGYVLTLTNIQGLRETADRLRKLSSIVADSTDAIIAVGLDGTIISWNRGATDLWKTAPDLSEHVELCDVLSKEFCELTDQLLLDIRRKGRADSSEINVTIDGTEMTLLVRATPVLDERDQVGSAALTIYDVTALREAETQLRLRTRAIEAASNGIVIVDAKDEHMPIIYTNQGFQQITGYGSNEIYGRNCRFLQGPGTSEEEVEKIRQAIADQKSHRAILLNYRRDGTPFYNDLVLTPIFADDGKLTHYVGVQNDVTEMVEASRKIQQSEAEYRSTFETAAVGIAHVGIDGRWLRVNDKVCNITGYDREQLFEKTFQEITHPDDIDLDVRQFGPLMRGDNDGYSLQKRYIHREGHIVWVNLTTSLRRNADGEPECCISIIEDITARKETEEQLSQSRAIIGEVIESVEDAFISFDQSGVVQFANHAAKQLANNDGKPIVGRALRELLQHEETLPLYSLLERVRTSQRDESIEYLAPELKRWYDARAFPADGGAALYMSDVTARKETETHLERARAAAEEASRVKTKFLTNMSHEIRSPMSAILGFCDIALRDLREGKSVNEDHLETIIRNGRFLLRIINDILDLSKVEAGKLQVRTSRFQLLPMVADVRELMRHRSKSTELPLTFEFGSDVPQMLTSDRSRVEQILVNLIGNAIKFTQQGSVRVVIEAESSERRRLLFRVIDTGIGISQANIARLFQTFSQVHGNNMSGVEGTGLGLAISKRLAKLLDGDIHVQSVEGEGSTFTLSLPIEAPENETWTQPTESDLRVKKTKSAELGSIEGRVLIADDARDVRFVAKHFLSKAGADVTEVVNGAEAVSAVREAEREGRPFHCILMDMQMPEMDGRAATEAIRSEGFTLPIIALTAGATGDEVQEALAVGCTLFISKPVDGPALVKQVAKLTKD